MKKILIAPNSFKESASSVELAELFYRYLKSPDYEIIIKPISDGGDGFLNVCRQNYDLDIIRFTCHLRLPPKRTLMYQLDTQQILKQYSLNPLIFWD